MGIVVTYLAYLAVSVSLTVFVGSALSRSGQIFLLDVFGGHPVPARAASRLMVVAFYLLNLGFVTLTMRMSGEIGSARQVIQVARLRRSRRSRPRRRGPTRPSALRIPWRRTRRRLRPAQPARPPRLNPGTRGSGGHDRGRLYIDLCGRARPDSARGFKVVSGVQAIPIF